VKFVVREVERGELDQLFFEGPRSWYDCYDAYVPVPVEFQKRIFSPVHNTRLRYLPLMRWLAINEFGVPLGRIAAFGHPKPASTEKAGGIGFFDCIDNSEVAAALLQAAEAWLLSGGFLVIDGPIQPGENDQYWGLLSGNHAPVSFGSNWHPPYLEAFWHSAGYEVYYEQLTFGLSLKEGLTARFFKIAAWAKSRSSVEVKSLKVKQLPQFAADLAHIYNHAWTDFENFKRMEATQPLLEFERMKQILIPDLVWFAYMQGEPAAFILMLPDINDLLKGIGSKLDAWGKIKFWWGLKSKRCTKLKVVVMGVHHRFQKMGLESVLVEAAYLRVKNKYPHFEQVELAWVGDFNEPMKALNIAAGAKPVRRHLTLRKYLHEAQEVKKFRIQKG
jgi:GNAT superfamily N-acetyltransferase